MSSENIKINVAQDFSSHPYGRYPDDGDSCGEIFREKLLKPALEKSDHVMVVLDGVAGYGSSFLDEVFGGIVRDGTLSARDFTARISIISDDDTSLIEEVNDYVQDATGED
ncbi:STAS-like domain-containing protein [Thalassospira lucentensis]|uniref:STAS-like domain-containing protein n=1 Tax=Thalassospira lucentensis TaxID=168935 RepID=UPI003AA88DC7